MQDLDNYYRLELLLWMAIGGFRGDKWNDLNFFFFFSRMTLETVLRIKLTGVKLKQCIQSGGYCVIPPWHTDILAPVAEVAKMVGF